MFLDVSGEDFPRNQPIHCKVPVKKTAPLLTRALAEPRCWSPPSIWDFPCCQPVRHIEKWSYEPIWWIYGLSFGSHMKESSLIPGERSTFDPPNRSSPGMKSLRDEKQHGSDLHEVDINGKVIPHHPRFHLGIGTQMKEGQGMCLWSCCGLIRFPAKKIW